MSAPTYDELGRRLREVAAGETGMAVASRLDEIAGRLGAIARTVRDLEVADLLSMMGLAVAELRAASTQAKVDALLSAFAEEVAVLLPSDFQDGEGT